MSVLGAHVQKTYDLQPAQIMSACDMHPELIKYPEVACERVEPGGRLPCEAESFDIVTCIETIEHIEDQFGLVREFHRVTRPGGRVIVTTPNVLNINSRLRNLHSGFTQLFDPLPLRVQEPVHLSGHIHPVNFYYLAYQFHRAGFREVKAHFDFQKRSGIALAALFYLPLLVWHAGFHLRMKRKHGAVYKENCSLLSQINRWRMLTSRTLILEAIK